MVIDTRIMETAGAAEFYITATPTAGLPLEKQAQEVFAAIAQLLNSKKARIMQERVFSTYEVASALMAVRAKAYGSLDDGVPPAWLVAPAAAKIGPFSGVVVHAVVSPEKIRKVDLGGKLCGRAMKCGKGEFLAVTGLTAPEAGYSGHQARAMFEKTESILKQAGGDMFSVVRTWLWLGDILPWYGELNRVRNQFFSERGLLNGEGRLPASTGIGISPAGHGVCTMDFVATVGEEQSIRYLQAAGKQNSAFKYGSAFSRAARGKTPAGETVYISGTAAINAAGETIFLDDNEKQVRNTIENVQAVIRNCECADADVVQVIAYCKTPAAEAEFLKVRDQLPWPVVVCICDVCRDNLLFEIEAIACPGAKKMQ